MAASRGGIGSDEARASESGQAGCSRRSLLRVAGLGALGVAGLTACADSSHGSSPAPTSAVTVTDQRRKKVRLARPARRVVTIPMPAAAMVIAVDKGARHVCGMHRASWLAIRDGIMGEMFPAAKKIAHEIATSDFTPNVESIVALDPDVVVQWSDNGSGIITPLENAGLDVVGLTYGTQRDVSTWITVFGGLLGKAGRAKEMNSRISHRLTAAKAGAPRSGSTRPSIVYFNRFTGGYKIAGEKSYNDFYIDLVGGTNPATGKHGVPGAGMVGVDVEQVLAWDPDILLLGNFDAATPADVYRSKVLRSLAAVKARRVYKVPLGGYRWDPPSHESPLMWQWLSAVAFPTDKAGKELRTAVVDDYEFLYGHTPTKRQLDAILQLDANEHAADYDQFHAG